MLTANFIIAVSCVTISIYLNETEQGLLLVRIQDIIATLCKQKGTVPEDEMVFLEPLKMDKWVKTTVAVYSRLFERC